MPKAYTQNVIHLKFLEEVDKHLAHYGVNIQRIDFFMYAIIGTGDRIILKGYYEIRKAGEFKDYFYEESSAIVDTDFNGIDINPAFLAGSFQLKHNPDFRRFYNGLSNMVLQPHNLNPASPVSALYYTSDSIEQSAILPLAAGSLFPSPPATGSFG